ncbi:MAG: L-methionine/branched-chain amino acid transporter [Reinekea sp.]|jgi:amino acid efflux transporter
MQQTQASIGRWQGVGLLVTTMLGTGLFILPQLTVELVGAQALWSWTLLVLAMLPVAQVYAALGRQYPHAGGPAQFVELAFSPRQGRIIGLMFLLMVPIGAPAAIEITMEFVSLLVPVSGVSKPWIELALLGSILLLNWRGIQASSIWQTALTLTILAIVIVLLLVRPSPEEQVQPLFHSGGGSILTALGLAVWSFIGVETMTHLVTEFKNPRRDFQFALLMGVLLVGLIYLGCTWLMLSVSTGGGLAMSLVFDRVFGAGGRWIIGIVGALSGLATINVYVASASRLMASLSAQGALPAVFARQNRFRVPGIALMTELGAISVVLLTATLMELPYSLLIQWTNGVIVLIYLMSMLAGIKLVPSQRLYAVSAAALCLLFAVSLGINMLYGLILWGSLQLLYFLRQRPSLLEAR